MNPKEILILLLALVLCGCNTPEESAPVDFIDNSEGEIIFRMDSEAPSLRLYIMEREVVSCSVCGKDTTEVFGIEVTLSEDGEYDKHLKHSLSPYEPRDYDICWGCMLKSLGVKIPERKSSLEKNK